MKKLLFTLLGIAGLCCTQGVAQPAFPISVAEGKLQYATDKQGNRILDFSYCGYRNSNELIPDAEVVYTLSPSENDSELIQGHIDALAALPLNERGLRGAILLKEGTYLLDEPLRISASGIVLRGESKEKTVLVKRGVERGAVIYIEGATDRQFTGEVVVTTERIPVGTTSFEVASVEGLQVGQQLVVEQQPVARPRGRDAEVTEALMRQLGPGNIRIGWDRTITAIEGNRLTLDDALTFELGLRPVVVKPYTWAGRIDECGVEHLTLVSDYDKSYPMDENHAWTGVWLNNAEDCWVRQVDFRQFAGAAVAVQREARRVTVSDCQSFDPVSEMAGSRRRTFFTLGQHTLFLHCYSEHGQHDFSAGINAPGPNAFVQSDSYLSTGFSGSTGSWACGLLFDIVNIDGHDLSFKKLERTHARAGWNTANSVAWQCTAAGIECYAPRGYGMNYANGSWATMCGDGVMTNSDEFVKPYSLFRAQLAARIGAEKAQQITRIYDRDTNATSSPTIEQAIKLAKQAYEPRVTIPMWIAQAPFTASVEDNGRQAMLAHVDKAYREVDYALKNGRLTANDKLLVGGRQNVRWWSGNLAYDQLEKATDHVTRFVPDREGQGLTDRIDKVVANMKERGVLLLDHNYGLWYDRRRDDHIRVRRRDGDVWAPHYEQPFARSGEGQGWDGMSKYDLTKPNTWYWSRLKEFAEKASREGLLLFHQDYFQHNIIEAGAHWVDSPWRTPNNINNTGFAEPTNFAGDKRVFVADMFYDVNHPARRPLHRGYIRMCLEQLADYENVVHLISEEYTGPLHFVEFWLDCIAEWEAETGKEVLIALSATKDVQDAILRDPVRSKVVDIIDIRYWHHRSDGTTYEPEGGVSMAPRQYARKIKVGTIDFASTYRAVSEYRAAYPEKAVTFFAQSYPSYGWAILLAGGSCPTLHIEDERLLAAIPAMTTAEKDANSHRLMGEKGGLIYLPETASVTLSLPKGNYTLHSVDMKRGVTKRLVKQHKSTTPLVLNRAGLYWVEKTK
ncbi:MAG: pectate lyase [Alistipes sp.]|nr:pectate lyase [Alistipes sp.]